MILWLWKFRRSLCPRVAGENADGSAAEDHLLEFLSEISTEARSRLVVLRLLDNIEDRSPDNFKDAKNFRALYPVERLPSVISHSLSF